MTTPSAIEPELGDMNRRASTPHVAHDIALGELQDHLDAGRAPAIADRVNPLHRVAARIRVCVGEITVTLGELLAVREQHVFILDHAIEEPVELLLEGQVVARGQLVAVDEQFAVRITQLPLPLKP